MRMMLIFLCERWIAETRNRRNCAGVHAGLAPLNQSGGEPPQPFLRPRCQNNLRRSRDPCTATVPRSEEHTSELQSLMRNSYAVFCFKKKNNKYKSNILEHTAHTQ